MTTQTHIVNRRARHDYAIEKTYEAGLCLEGWEVKAIRAGRMQLQEAYVRMLGNRPCLVGAHITPLEFTATHTSVDATRTRSLLLNASEIKHLTGLVMRDGYTLIPLDVHFTRGRAKMTVGLAKGKQKHDKRTALKDADWAREQAVLMKQRSR